MIDLKKALITGASSGIGREFARELASKGYETILVARRYERLKDISEELTAQFNSPSTPVQADLSQRDDLERVSGYLYGVDLLVNNAGFGLIGSFSVLEGEKELEMIRLNVESLYRLSKFYVIARREQGGGIINVASTAAYLPVPFMAVYAATKAFVLSFSEALSEELKDSNFKVMVLSPGPTNTEFFEVASGKSRKVYGSMAPEKVVKKAMSAYEKSKRSVVSGFSNKVVAGGSKIAPKALLLKVAGRVFRDF
ncbi:SDR family NAD(P)-dependent oxidoreductase [Mesotoga infera]|uniref:SDR family NAD(P)-dependent oxidoreductase n=1 Tax=Mesotoga infera TaxID=1236046 RepID=UPI00146B767E|nr:SDR family oxidoreductase [Mesotoga infera]